MKAKRRNAYIESVNPLDIYGRDEWKCGICGEKVEKAIAYPDPQSASLDHIIPIARGGKHSLGNVQLAHLECNIRKGATLPELYLPDETGGLGKLLATSVS